MKAVIQVRAVFSQAVSLKLVMAAMVLKVFYYAVMIKPDYAVLNINVSSAETHINTLKGKGAFIH